MPQFLWCSSFTVHQNLAMKFVTVDHKHHHQKHVCVFKICVYVYIKYFSKIIQQMKENAGFFTFWLKQIFLTHAHISYQPIKTCVWQYITNQDSWDVTAVFTYSHLNTAIDQWECVYYPNYFIQQNAKHKCTPCYTVLCLETCWHCVSGK